MDELMDLEGRIRQAARAGVLLDLSGGQAYDPDDDEGTAAWDGRTISADVLTKIITDLTVSPPDA